VDSDEDGSAEMEDDVEPAVRPPEPVQAPLVDQVYVHYTTWETPSERELDERLALRERVAQLGAYTAMLEEAEARPAAVPHYRTIRVYDADADAISTVPLDLALTVSETDPNRVSHARPRPAGAGAHGTSPTAGAKEKLENTTKE
jgi:hypothetical protein